MVAILSYDEKPGIQAIGVTAPDLPPVEGKHPCWGRDHEYVRHGTVSLIGSDRSFEWSCSWACGGSPSQSRVRRLPQVLGSALQAKLKIRVVLGNHSAHISKETRTYLLPSPIDSSLCSHRSMDHGST